MKTSHRRVVIAWLVAGLAALLWWTVGRDDVSPPEPEVAEASVGAADRAGASLKPKPVLPRQRALELEAAPKAVVSGTVTGQDGGPVAGAQVCAAVLENGSEAPREIPCTRSEADGHYRIEGLRASRYDVAASAPHHIPSRHVPEGRRAAGVRLVAGKERRGVDITLRSGGVQIFGTVRDIAGGEIPGAQVASGRRFWSPQIPVVAVADDEGEFSMWVEEGTAYLEATAEGYASESKGGRAPGTHFTLYLTPESVVVGRVVDVATSEPIEGAKVSAGDRRVLTDSTGSFRVEGLKPGTYKPTATADDGYGEAESSVHLSIGQTSDSVLIALHPAVSVSGTVLVRVGDTVSACEEGGVRLRPKPGSSGISRRARVETEGDVHVAGVLPGRYEVFARCDGFVSEDSYGELEVKDEPIAGLRWETTPGSELRGRVLADDPSRLLGIHVRARSIGGEARGKSGWSSTEKFGPDGSFVLTGLTPNTYKITVSGSDVPEADEPLEVVVPEGESVDGIEIELPAGAVIRGRVEDSAGQPVSAANVRAEGAGWNSAQVDDNGEFEVRGLKAGEYRVVAALDWVAKLRKPGTTDDDVQGELVQVEAGGSAEVTLVVETREASISGVVVDASGGPVADAYIRAKRVSDSDAASAKGSVRSARWGGWDRQPLMSDTDGSFTVEGLSEGSYTVWAIRRSGGEGYVENVSTGSDGVTVQLQDTASVRGRVAASAGSVPQRFELQVRDEATGFYRSESFFATDGKFVIEELPPGTLFISATSGEGSGDTEVIVEAGAEKAGVKIELQNLVTVKGRVVDAETGEPVAGVRVMMSRKKGRVQYRGDGKKKLYLSDAQGYYELEGVPVGRVSVRALPKDWGEEGSYGPEQAFITVEDTDPFTAPDIEMVRARVKATEQAGSLGFTLAQPDPGTDPEEYELVVAVVRPGGPAAKAGLEVGATIISVDGLSVTDGRSRRYHVLTRVPAGTSVKLGLEGGSSVTVVAEKEP